MFEIVSTSHLIYRGREQTQIRGLLFKKAISILRWV